MKYIFLKNNIPSKELIIFFSGWGLEDNILKLIDHHDSNCLYFYDYRDLTMSPEAVRIIKTYQTKQIISWSMGVMVASLFKDLLIDCQQKIALCGSGIAVNDNYGIPLKAYQLTMESFSEKVMYEFIKKMRIPESATNQLVFKQPIAEKLAELRFLISVKINKPLKYDKVLIAKKDRIFPRQNLENYWRSQQSNIVMIDCGHYPFKEYSSWQQILEL